MANQAHSLYFFCQLSLTPHFGHNSSVKSVKYDAGFAIKKLGAKYRVMQSIMAKYTSNLREVLSNNEDGSLTAYRLPRLLITCIRSFDASVSSKLFGPQSRIRNRTFVSFIHFFSMWKNQHIHKNV